MIQNCIRNQSVMVPGGGLEPPCTQCAGDFKSINAAYDHYDTLKNKGFRGIQEALPRTKGSQKGSQK